MSDPDSFIREHGPQAFQQVLDKSVPLAEMLWFRALSEAGDLSDPSRRAALETRVFEEVGRIQHPTVRRHYQQWMRERLRQHFGGKVIPFRGADKPLTVSVTKPEPVEIVRPFRKREA